MGEATRTYFIDVLRETVDLLGELEVPYVLVGSLAKTCHFEDAWDPGSDIDLLVKKDDAERCLREFPKHGFATHVREPTWIYKVAKPNVTIDLIFWSAGAVELTDDMIARACRCPFEGVEVRVPSIEDMALLLVLLDSEERPGYWYDAMRYLRAVEDWDYLGRRARELRPVKVLSALLYARETGLHIPDGAVEALSNA